MTNDHEPEERKRERERERERRRRCSFSWKFSLGPWHEENLNQKLYSKSGPLSKFYYVDTKSRDLLLHYIMKKAYCEIPGVIVRKLGIERREKGEEGTTRGGEQKEKTLQ